MLEERLRINGKLLKSSIVTASGCRATTLETILWYSDLIPEIGIFSTKSIGPIPNTGNLAPIYCADPAFGQKARRNAVGLANPGHKAFSEELAKMRKESPDLNNALLLGSVYGANLLEILTVCESIAPYVDAIEVNFSCPHAIGYGFDMAREEDAIAAIVYAVCRATGRDVFAKLSPNLPDNDLGSIAKACVDKGAKGITVINTVEPRETYLPGTEIPILFNGRGGLSGPCVKERGLNCVKIVRQEIGADPLIIGMGGIYTGKDARDYLAVGADLIGIGTVMEGMDSQTLSRYVRHLDFDINNDTDNAERLIPDVNLQYEEFRIERIDEVSYDLRVFHFDKSLAADPCQYVFLAVPGNGLHPTMEAPFSVPLSDPLTLAIRLHQKKSRKHHFTSRLWNQEAGDTVFIRGPYGVPFSCSQDEDIYLVGGGTGVAALSSIAGKHGKYTAFIGAKTERELLFMDSFKEGRVIPATQEKCDAYHHGLVTQVFIDYARSEGMDQVVTCGPVPMMQKVVKTARRIGFDDHEIHVVLEPYMKCGVEICSSCSLGDGAIACGDGHIVTADRFMEFIDQDRIKRTATGGWDHHKTR